METSPREVFKQEIEGQIKEIDAKIDLIKARIEQMDAQNKMMYQEDFAVLLAEKERMKNDLDMIESTDEGAWDKIKMKTKEQWEKFKIRTEDFYDKL